MRDIIKVHKDNGVTFDSFKSEVTKLYGPPPKDDGYFEFLESIWND